MTTTARRSVARVLTIPCLASLILAAGPAGLALAAHITCGAVLGPGGTFTLDSDVGPCDDPAPAITVDSASLDLNGFTVSCRDDNRNGTLAPGIRVVGVGA